ncbi:hypothetical protein [Klebsiella quasipneumoniae]|uniref:hypothetical protein n=1 Tax=Klebsiella quasipneumoniae TaxID=1463165 RepID=UPI00296F68A8|nr:hypothetical protein [Klebsiella quasipneumoniae]
MGLNLVFSKAFVKRYIDVIDGVSLTYQKYSEIAQLISLTFIVAGFILWCICVYLALRDLNKRDIALIRAYGFENTDPHAAENALYQRKAKILHVDFKAFDSRIKITICPTQVISGKLFKIGYITLVQQLLMLLHSAAYRIFIWLVAS